MELTMDSNDKNKSEEEQQSDKNPKKRKRFSGKEFRENLNIEFKTVPALKEFIKLCTDDNPHEIVLEYLESGGSCLEILQMLEKQTEMPQVFVIQVANYIMLTTLSHFPQYHAKAEEAARYFLNNHVTVINKMLGLKSYAKERKSILKFLTAIVSLSASLAKDILVHISFNKDVLDLATRATSLPSKNVRVHFIHFLIAFLIDGHWPTISTLLDKRGLLTSVIHNLLFDDADTVCMVLTTLRTQILENPVVSKTVKMHTFSTPVVKDLVNLYGWKGPENYDPKTKNAVTNVKVDENGLSKVNECLHAFLLVLCTSHKFGIVFKDHSVGQGKRSKNNLLVTVLEHLDRPWDNELTGELVIKICFGSPDLVKNVWLNLKPFLEPRATEKWLNAVNFAQKLLENLQPACIEFYVAEMSVQQLFHVIQSLVAPTQILRTINVNNFEFELTYVKYRSIVFLITMLRTVNLYSNASQKWLSVENCRKLQNLLNEHIFKQFPNSAEVFKAWDKVDEPIESVDVATFDSLKNLDAIIELLNLYTKLCPQLSSDLNTVVNLQNLLKKVAKIEDDSLTKNKLSIKLIDLYASVDPKIFSFGKSIFKNVMPILIENLVNDQNDDVMNILEVLFLQSSIFDGCLYEIRIWLRSILHVKSLDCNSLSDFFISVLLFTNAQKGQNVQKRQNVYKFLLEMGNLKQQLINDDVKEVVDDYDELIETLKQDNIDSKMTRSIRHVHLSPFILRVLEFAVKNELDKSVLQYLNVAFTHLLHIQTDPLLLMYVLKNDKYDGIVLPAIKTYLKKSITIEDDIVPIKKPFDSTNFLSIFSEALINNKVNSQLFVDFPVKTGDALELVNMGLFYFCQMIKCKKMNPEKLKSYIDLFSNILKIGILDKKNVMEMILCHPILLLNFSPTNVFLDDAQGMCSKFIVTILKESEIDLTTNENQLLLIPFRNKLVAAIIKMVKNYKNKKCSIANDSIPHIIEVLGLTIEETTDIIKHVSEVPETAFISEENSFSVIYHILIDCLTKFNNFYNVKDPVCPLAPEIIFKLTEQFVNLEKRSDQLNSEAFALALKNYLEIYLHDINHVHSDLFEVTLKHAVFCKNYCLLATFLLQHNLKLLDIFYRNLENLSNKKGMILALTDIAISNCADTEALQKIYDSFEHSVLKALTKPHKAGSHFEEFYPTVVSLITNCMSEKSCISFVSKLHKFDSSDVFHVHLLIAVFEKLCFRLKSGNEKYIVNAILSLTHIQLNLFKKKTDESVAEKIVNIAKVFNTFLEKLIANEDYNKYNYDLLVNNESLKLFIKFCLKYGISGKGDLLNILCSLNKLLNMKESDAALLMDMILSHSEFLELMLGEDGAAKTWTLQLILILCEKHPPIMARNHIPIWLSSYHASMSTSDRITLNILRRYGSASSQTNFYDFKPYLWGQQACNHYSLRSDVQNTLWKQPRSGDILEILNCAQILKTIKHFPINVTLNGTEDTADLEDRTIYDPSFLLPLFNSLLAPESEIQTYRFTKSGALAIVISALCSKDKNMRLAACNILARLHFHLDAKRHGKDKLLWLRFVEVICRGTAVLENVHLGSFAALFLSRMALVLSEPMNPLYVPLSQYLSAKEIPDLSGVPEIYTLLHSSEVNFNEHRKFILEILRDGLRVEADLHVMLRSMAFKFIMDSVTSVITDSATKLLILEIICKACKLNEGMKLLTNGYGLFPWLYSLVQDLDQSDVELLQQVVAFCRTYCFFMKENCDKAYANMFNLIVLSLLKKIHYLNSNNVYLLDFIGVLEVIVEHFPNVVTDEHLKELINLYGTNYCHYMLKFGSDFTMPAEKLIGSNTDDAMIKLTSKYIFKKC